ncbi:hypothetical protein [Hymenobacter terrenus]|uniref:hypothetical protein n=1 Tax=Hymenobacter terrenus TaxID=1629124 RepID=UPI000AE6A30A|nr:hypothetical protein [Hymenobacter terrenus]
MAEPPRAAQRPAVIYRADKGMYQFRELVLAEVQGYPYPGLIRYELPADTLLTLRQFKRYTNSVSGFTHLFALGEAVLC